MPDERDSGNWTRLDREDHMTIYVHKSGGLGLVEYVSRRLMISMQGDGCPPSPSALAELSELLFPDVPMRFLSGTRFGCHPHTLYLIEVDEVSEVEDAASVFTWPTLPASYLAEMG